MFSKERIMRSTGKYSDNIKNLTEALGRGRRRRRRGRGLSTSAGFVYCGERLSGISGRFRAKYGFSDMYSGGFYPYPTPEEQWAYWSRHIYINRYMDAPKPVYDDLLRLVKDKDYFVLTTNVDHCFQKAGFDKQRLFYTQGDYGLWQCSVPCHDETYDNEETVRRWWRPRAWSLADGALTVPEGHAKMTVPHRAGATLPRVRRAHDHEPALRRYLRGGRGLASGGRALLGLRPGAIAGVLFLELGVATTPRASSNIPSGA